jgi:hypothetical protein
MTTENNVTEQVQSQFDIVGNFVKENDYATVVQHIVDLQVKAKVATEANERLINERDMYRKNHREAIDTVEEFLKEHIKDQQVSIDDLKELAAELDIELTKRLEITFKVDVKYIATVPLDFDEDDISDGDFNINIDYRGHDSDVEVDEEWVEVEDFEVEEE